MTLVFDRRFSTAASAKATGSTIAGFMLWEGKKNRETDRRFETAKTRYLRVGFSQVPAFARAAPLLLRVLADFHSSRPPLFRVNNGWRKWSFNDVRKSVN